MVFDARGCIDGRPLRLLPAEDPLDTPLLRQHVPARGALIKPVRCQQCVQGLVLDRFRPGNLRPGGLGRIATHGAVH